MKYQLFLLSLALSLRIYAQQAEPVYFRDKVFDFGSIREQDGPVTHEFTFINQTGRPVKIVSVQASCGCTTPDWSRDPVAYNKTGFIRAQYDPVGRPGYFNKSLTVVTDADPTPIILQIKGNVTMADQQPDFSVARGALHFPSRTINFNKVYINQSPVTFKYDVINRGEKTVKIHQAMAPVHLTVEVPELLEPNVPAWIKVKYDPKVCSKYGFTSDNLTLITSDAPDSIKSISVYATVEEFFPTLSAEEEKLAPRIGLPLAELDFGRVRQGVVVEREVPIRNLGKRELVIRAVQGNCECVQPVATKTRLKPGEDGRIKIKLDATQLSGTQEKAVTIYSTDPVTPVFRIVLKAYVDN